LLVLTDVLVLLWCLLCGTCKTPAIDTDMLLLLLRVLL
jgi:hypothetical protein